MNGNSEEKINGKDKMSDSAETEISHGETKVMGFVSKILCVVAAFIMWMYVAGDQTYEKTFENIPVSLEGENSIVEAGLEAMMNREAVTTVTVRGKRSRLNSLTAEELSPHVSLRGISSSQLYMLPIKVNTPQDVSAVSISPESLSVYVDKMKLETVPLTARIISGGVKDTSVNNISVKLDVTEVTVEGPSEIVGNISSAVVELDLGGVISSSVDISGSVRLVDANGAEVVSDYISVIPSTVNAHIPVYTSKSVRVSPDFAGFSSDGYTCEINPQFVTVKSEDAELLDDVDKVFTTPINLDSDSGSTSMYELVIPDGVILDSEDTRVEVKLSNNIGKSLAIKNIVYVNLEDSLSVNESESTESVEVHFVGNISALNSLSSEDYCIIADLEGHLNAGKFTVPVYVVPIKNNEDATVDGEYEISVTLEKHEG